MPYYETPDELAEDLADKLGVYGSCTAEEEPFYECVGCRICWVEKMIARIKASVEAEKALDKAQKEMHDERAVRH